ncbi:MAG TPA: hypothetical protein VIT67_15205 [Povalibacter sp.]
MSMHRWWVKKVVGCVALIVIGGAALGWLVTSLWNWLLPPLFGLGAITFWQGLGLFLLGRLLFGGFRIFGGHHGHHRHHMHERWKHMTPEERESFSRGLKRCGWGYRHGHDGSSHDEASATSRAES